MKSGILLIDKPAGKTSFYLVYILRKLTGIKKIGHAGTLDPLATGVMVMLIGREATRLSDKFIGHHKTYETTIFLGARTTTLDSEGDICETSPFQPSLEQVKEALSDFQGSTFQTPPMYSAKKVQGKKLYDLARKGEEIQRKPCQVWMQIDLLEYTYPLLRLKVHCSSGTYIRSLADDLGSQLSCFGHIQQLRRIQSGPFSIEECHALENITKDAIPLRTIDENSLLY